MVAALADLYSRREKCIVALGAWRVRCGRISRNRLVDWLRSHLALQDCWGRCSPGYGVSPFKTQTFARFADREDDALCEAIRRVWKGLIEDGLGGRIVKQRIARHGNVA